MTQYEEQHVRLEIRHLRQENATLKNAWQKQKAKAAALAEQNRRLSGENKKLKDENEAQHAKLESVTTHKDKLAGMIFKANTKESSNGNGRKRGGQAGHRGHARKKPRHIDHEKNVYLTACPQCDHPLNQSNTTYDRIVEDIPIPQTVVTRYHIQRQWCAHCGKEVCAVPLGTLPGFHVGLNLITLILILKYRLRTPLAKIGELLKTQYQLTITEGGVQNILHRMSHYHHPQYQKILRDIRKSRVKHADETSWRIEGQNGWCWLFATQKAAYYTIEETRGKGVPQKVLTGNQPESVLVRDDYGGYAGLNVNHQSCWTHLLRVSREATERETVSSEMMALHQELKGMFGELQATIECPFDAAERRLAFGTFQNRITAITARPYRSRDAQTVQTRINNQHTNLLTAVLHEDVPLTNNHAERQIRSMVVTRKISGGSRSNHGAATHAVNMSIRDYSAFPNKHGTMGFP